MNRRPGKLLIVLPVIVCHQSISATSVVMLPIPIDRLQVYRHGQVRFIKARGMTRTRSLDLWKPRIDRVLKGDLEARTWY
jgi:hypothetical protein